MPQLRHHLGGNGVEIFGSIQPQRIDRSVSFNRQRFVFVYLHDFSPRL